MRLPNAFGEPRAERTLPEDRMHTIRQRAYLAHAISARHADEHGLVVAARKELDLAAPHQVGEVADDVGPVRLKPVKEWTGEVKARLHLRVAIERGHERRICTLGHLLDD